MSYSCCFKCGQMVPAYEKYCGACLKSDRELKQVPDYWKTNVPMTTPSRSAAEQSAEELLRRIAVIPNVEARVRQLAEFCGLAPLKARMEAAESQMQILAQNAADHSNQAGKFALEIVALRAERDSLREALKEAQEHIEDLMASGRDLG